MLHSQRRRKRKRDQGSVEMNLAAMLDMAFQLLAFFILTFKPAPVEGQLALNMPPPVSQIKPEAQKENAGDGVGELPDLESTLHLSVSANNQGDVNDFKVESNPLFQGRFDEMNAQRLDRRLHQLFAGQSVPFDRIQIAVDGRLRYGELMKIIDVCHRQRLPDGTAMQKISFTEVEAGGTK